MSSTESPPPLGGDAPPADSHHVQAAYIEALGSVTAHGTLREIEDVADLPLIWNDDCNSVLLRRPDGPLLAAADLDQLEIRWRHELRLRVAADPSGLETLREATLGIPNGELLAADLHELTVMFCELTAADAAGVRLARLTRRMCPRFHVDRVLVRMLLTLRGTTTQVATDVGLGQRLAAFNKTPEADPANAPAPQERVVRPRLGDLLLLRGSLWNTTTVGPAVHRSPSASRSAPRLVCSWDPIH